MMWDAISYHRFGKERIQPSIDLANRIEIKECKRILDVGCGSGMSTISIRNRFPDAEIVGVDLSENMLEKAKECMNDVTWIQRDCSKPLTDLGTFDLVFSNAFLQWLDNQEEFIQNTRALLNPDGVLAMQIPDFDEMPISDIIKETAQSYDRKNKLFCFERTCNNFSARTYYDMFTSCYSDVEVWQTNYYHQMDSSDAIVDFVQSTALIPYLSCLTEEQAAEFIAMLKYETAKQYQPCGDGTVLFPFYRLFFIARNHS